MAWPVGVGTQRLSRRARFAFAQLRLDLSQLRPILGDPLLQARRDRGAVPHPRRPEAREELVVDRHLHALRHQQPFDPIDQPRPICRSRFPRPRQLPRILLRHRRHPHHPPDPSVALLRAGEQAQ